MRRSLLTASGPPVPLVLGYDPDLGTTTGSSAARLMWTDAQALSAGTLANIKFHCTAAGVAIAFFTIDAAHVVRAISANTTSVNGISNYPVSLAAVAGDRVGVWTNAVLSVRFHNSVPGYTQYSQAAGAKPNPGDTLTPSTSASRAWGIYGT